MGPIRQRHVVSNKTNQMVKASGKIKIQWSDFHSGPSRTIFSLLVRDIGTAAKSHVPMLAPTFGELEKHHQDTLTSYLENLYDISSNDTRLIGYIKKKVGQRYRAWKYSFHKHFKRHRAALPGEFKLRPEQWDYLVNKEFLDQSKKATSKRNKMNQIKNPNIMNHHSGPTPISHRAEDLMKKGHPTPFVQVALDIYLPSKNEKEKVESLKKSLDEVVQAREEVGSGDAQAYPLPLAKQCDILVKCLGERRGTEVRGLGRDLRRPAKKRGGAWNIDSVVKRQELEDRAQKAEERAMKAEEDAKQANEKCDRVIGENNDLRKRMAALEKYVQQLVPSQLNFEVVDS